jgi:hypothetical protein
LEIYRGLWEEVRQYRSINVIGGAYVPNITDNVKVPTSGTISLSHFYGAKKAAPLPQIISYFSPATFTTDVDTWKDLYTFTAQRTSVTFDFTVTSGWSETTISLVDNNNNLIGFSFDGNSYS